MNNNNSLITGIKIKNTAVGYGRKIIIDDVDIMINPGEIISIIGPNGSGKSTLLKSIIGELKLIKGTILINDTNITDTDRKELSKTMSVLMTDRIKTELTTCFDIVAFARYPYTGRLGILSEEDIRIVNDALSLVNAKELADVDFSCISDGQRQRIMLAKCIAQEPEIIILDEPTTFLDIKYKIEIFKIIKELSTKKNITVVMSLHEVDFAKSISDRVICVKNGKVDKTGSADVILTDEYIRNLYEISIEDYNIFFSSDAGSEFRCRNKKLLRKGITTGTCAAAAARASILELYCGISSSMIPVDTPSGERVYVDTVKEGLGDSFATYSVIKYSGDDPDITNGSKINVKVQYTDEIKETYFHDIVYEQLYLTGADGIGIVTKEGLEQEIGFSAINKVPRRMIFDAVGQIIDKTDLSICILITVSVENGSELAKKTFNPMLGIEGGISILGTSGIIEPMSEQAIVDTIDVLIKQQSVRQKKVLLVNPGLYGQRYVKENLHIDITDSIKCSNYIGDTIDMASTYGFKYMLLVGNLGKLIKLAAGIMNTHSKVADGRMEIIVTHLALCGGEKEMISEIYNCINTDSALDKLKEYKMYDAVVDSITDAIDRQVKRRAGNELKVGFMIFSEKYGFISKNEYADDALAMHKTIHN